MNDDDLVKIAEQVSLLMQLDRTRPKLGKEIDMNVLANVPAYVASVFEEANALNEDLSPAEIYEQINKRVSQVQAQLYLMRLEFESRDARDPARIYEDPLVIAAYGERIDTMVKAPRTFSFGPEIIAYGWFPLERVGSGQARRWMRPGDASVACVPHLGTVDQVIEIHGDLLKNEQLAGFEIRVGDTRADITLVNGSKTQFVAKLTMKADALTTSNYTAIEFRMEKFMRPSEADPRWLGAYVGKFKVYALSEAAAEGKAG